MKEEDSAAVLKRSQGAIMGFFIARFSNRNGHDVWPVFTKKRPTISDIVADLKAEGYWTDDDDGRTDTYVEVTGPFPNPLTRPLRDMVDSYDDSGCEHCGVVGEMEYAAAKASLESSLDAAPRRETSKDR